MMDSILEIDAFDPLEPDPECGSPTSGTSRFGNLAIAFWSYTLIMFLIAFGCAVIGPASPRLIEMAVCRQYFEDHDPSAISPGRDIPEELCKSEEVQRSFTFMLTVLSTCTNLIAMIMQFPMGLLADKKSRRLALILNITSTILYWDWVVIVAYFHNVFPTWCLYPAPAFIVVGGGPWATSSLVFAAINDTVTPQQRTTAFSIMEAISGLAELLGSAIGVWTMSHQLWIPFLLATVMFVLMFVPTFLVAENRGRESLDARNASPDLSIPEVEPLLRNGDDHNIHASYAQSSSRPRLLSSKTTIFAVCFGSFFLIYTSNDAMNFIIPWVSLHFEQPMAKAGLLFSLRALVSTLLYFVVLPAITILISRTSKLTSASRDLALSRWSVFLICTGSFIVAFAPSLWILVVGFAITVLGSGASVTLRSFLASSVDPAFSGRLYTAISTVGTLGGLVGMPIMGAVYSWGLGHRSWNVAPPFMVAGIFNLIVIGVLAFL